MKRNFLTTLTAISLLTLGTANAQPTLPENGMLRGTVRDAATGVALPEISVEVKERLFVQSVLSDANGSFAMELPPGRYFLGFRGNFDWQGQLYQNRPCPPLDCDFLRGTPIDLAAGETISGLELRLITLGKIAGTVRRSADGTLITETVGVKVWNREGQEIASARTSQGLFQTQGLANGTYFVSVTDTSKEIGQLYGGSPFCQDTFPYRGCDPTLGQEVEVRAGEITSGIDFSLISGAFVRGRALASSQGGPPNYGWVSALDEQGQEVLSANLERGQYEIGPLAPGRFSITIHPNDYPAQVHPDTVCVGECDSERGTLIETRSGETRTGVDFQLHDFGRLTVAVRERISQAPVWAGIDLYDAVSLRRVLSQGTDPQGRYVFSALAPGRYLVAAFGGDHLGQVFPNVPFPNRQDPSPLAAATAIVVPEGAPANPITFELDRLGRMEGRIVAEETGAPLFNSTVYLFQEGNPKSVGSLSAFNEEGIFDKGVPAGDYYLVAVAPGARGRLVGSDEGCFQLFSGNASCDFTRGRKFRVRNNESIVVGDVELPAPALLRSRVVLAESYEQSIFFRVYSSTGGLVYQTSTFFSNAEDFEILLPSRAGYYLEAAAPYHYSQIYAGIDCAPGEDRCSDLTRGQLLTPAPGEEKSGLDFQMHLDRSKCRPSSSVLCLGDGRFSVSAYFATQQNSSSLFPSKVQPLTRDTGYLTFFDPNNVEVVVKVIDACRDYGHYWVFVAGLTDVAVFIGVHDRFTLEGKSYFNRFGDPFKPVVDLAAFATCDAPVPPDFLVEPLWEPESAPQALPNRIEGGCGGDPSTTLCLDNRFRVEVEWQTARGEQGVGSPGSLTANAGYFSFFGPDNIEIVVKALDACSPNLNQRYWIFAAGLTDVAVTMRITDTFTDQEKIYFSPLGQPFQPILDIEAFATCASPAP